MLATFFKTHLAGAEPRYRGKDTKGVTSEEHDALRVVTHAGWLIVVDVVDGVRHAGVLRSGHVLVVRLPVFLRRDRKRERERDVQYDARELRVNREHTPFLNVLRTLHYGITHLDDDVFQKSISFDGVVDLGLVITAEVDGLRVASALKIEDTVFVPSCHNKHKPTSGNPRYNRQETFS